MTEKKPDEPKLETHKEEHTAAAAPQPIALRKVKPLDDGQGDEDRRSTSDLREELKAALEAGKTIEIVPSDGKQEIAGTALVVKGQHPFETVAQGLKFTPEKFEVYGPGQGDVGAVSSIVGYGLLIDGEQVAWQQRPEELRLGAGQTYDLKNDILFESAPAG
jgi:hypothetical protein